MDACRTKVKYFYFTLNGCLPTALEKVDRWIQYPAPCAGMERASMRYDEMNSMGGAARIGII